MHILALDTTTRAGSAALWLDDRVVDVRTGDASRPHAERLPGDLIALLAEHGATPAAVDLFAVVAGPGGFTGLRVGIATVQGLAMVSDRPVLAVPTLLLLAAAAARETPLGGPAGSLVGAWMRAMRGEVFTALYRATDAPAPAAGIAPGPEGTEARLEARLGLVPIDEAAVGAPEETAARWHAAYPEARLDLRGDAVGELDAPLGRRFGPRIHLRQPPPLAALLAEVAAIAADLAGPPHAIVPRYVRRPDAELARERAAAAPVEPAGGRG